MSQYKQIDEKPVWLLMKKYSNSKIEFVGVYWLNETARKVAMENMPSSTDAFTLCIDQIKLFGSMIDKVQ